MRHYEIQQWEKDKHLLGIDEAGRGPMAGPCVVCGVVLPKGYENSEIDDSKKLSEKKRLALYKQIVEDALHVKIIEISVAEIDEKNIYQATKDAMKRISESLDVDYVITDAMPFTVENKTINAMVKADQKSISVAAASIVAKTYRDLKMIEYDKEFPEYGFAQHKGYGTKKHKEAILEYGRCSIHRNSFRFKDEAQVSLDI